MSDTTTRTKCDGTATPVSETSAPVRGMNWIRECPKCTRWLDIKGGDKLPRHFPEVKS